MTQAQSLPGFGSVHVQLDATGNGHMFAIDDGNGVLYSWCDVTKPTL